MRNERVRNEKKETGMKHGRKSSRPAQNRENEIKQNFVYDEKKKKKNDIRFVFFLPHLQVHIRIFEIQTHYENRRRRMRDTYIPYALKEEVVFILHRNRKISKIQKANQLHTITEGRSNFSYHFKTLYTRLAISIYSLVYEVAGSVQVFLLRNIRLKNTSAS